MVVAARYDVRVTTQLILEVVAGMLTTKACADQVLQSASRTIVKRSAAFNMVV